MISQIWVGKRHEGLLAQMSLGGAKHRKTKKKKKTDWSWWFPQTWWTQLQQSLWTPWSLNIHTLNERSEDEYSQTFQQLIIQKMFWKLDWGANTVMSLTPRHCACLHTWYGIYLTTTLILLLPFCLLPTIRSLNTSSRLLTCNSLWAFHTLKPCLSLHLRHTHTRRQTVHWSAVAQYCLPPLAVWWSLPKR